MNNSPAVAEENAFGREIAKSGMAALFEAVYDDPNLSSRQYIIRLVSIHHASSRVTVTAELTDHTTQLATADSELAALRGVLGKIAEYTGHLMEQIEFVSPAGLRLLGEREGLHEAVYIDVAGTRKIGYGHVLGPSELSSGKVWFSDPRPARWSEGITAAAAALLLEDDVRAAERAVRWSEGITAAAAALLLEDDVRAAERAVRAMVRVVLQQCQFDALVSFVFSVGERALEQSSLLRLLNDRQYDAVPGQLVRWVYAAGRKRHDLVHRRKAEAQQWRGKIPE